MDLVLEVAELQPDASLGYEIKDRKVPVVLSDIMTFNLEGTPDAERSNDRQVFLLFSRLADHQLREWLVLANGRFLKPPHEKDFHKVIGKGDSLMARHPAPKPKVKKPKKKKGAIKRKDAEISFKQRYLDGLTIHHAQ